MKRDRFDISIFIMPASGTLTHRSEYDEADDGRCEFVVLTGDALNHEYGNDNTMFIHREWRRQVQDIVNGFGNGIDLDDTRDGEMDHPGTQWQIEDDDIDVMCTEWDGQMQTLDILTSPEIDRMTEDYSRNAGEKYTKEEYIPAIMGAHSQNVTFGGKTYHGFLPAINQMKTISDNIFEINWVLGSIGIRKFETLTPRNNTGKRLRHFWWSSTALKSGGIVKSLIDGNIYGDVKDSFALVLPVFYIRY